MPKVTLTAAQREASRRDGLARRMADGLAVYKNRQSATNRQLAAELGIRLESVARILKADRTVRMDLDTFLKLSSIAERMEAQG